jgi:hypothetical protein
VTPIVTREESETVRALLSDPARRRSPGNERKHLLSGLLVCGVCGDKLIFRNTYLCGDHPGHVSIKKELAESHIRSEVANALLTGGSALFSGEDGEEIGALISAHQRNREAVSAIITDRDEGLVPADVARARLVQLRGERLSIETKLDRARNEKGAGAALLKISEELFTTPVVEMRDFRAAHQQVLDKFDRLDLSQQRDIVQALVYIELPKGRAPRRIQVQHLLATHLNHDQSNAPHMDD